MKLMQFAAKTAIAAALGASVLGAGAATAQADPHWPWPQPPGQDGFPPPGHRWMPVNVDNVIPPVWAPPAPPPPPWAPFAPVVWNADAQVWGVQLGASFVAL